MGLGALRLILDLSVDEEEVSERGAFVEHKDFRVRPVSDGRPKHEGDGPAQRRVLDLPEFPCEGDCAVISHEPFVVERED